MELYFRACMYAMHEYLRTSYIHAYAYVHVKTRICSVYFIHAKAIYRCVYKNMYIHT